MYIITYQLFAVGKKIGSGVFISPKLDENSVFNVMNKNNKLEIDVPYSVVFNFTNLIAGESGEGVFVFVKENKQPQFAEFSAN